MKQLRVKQSGFLLCSYLMMNLFLLDTKTTFLENNKKYKTFSCIVWQWHCCLISVTVFPLFLTMFWSASLKYFIINHIKTHLFNLVSPFDDNSLNVIFQSHITFFSIGFSNNGFLLFNPCCSLLLKFFKRLKVNKNINCYS